MGFFDTYTDLGGGGSYLKSDEKQFLIENGIAFEITALAEDTENSFGPRWVAFCQVPKTGKGAKEGETEEKKIAFPTDSGVSSRDDMLRKMHAYFQGEESEPVKVKLSKPGRAIFIEAA